MATDTEQKKSYKETLNLPQTTFAMEAKLVQNEPGRLKKWQEMGLYEKLMEARKDAPKWILHDGPPFANGDIHIGHLINKTLKDVILRFRSMQGKCTPYVPGWDCHGLPIEHKIQEQLGPKLRQMSVSEIRKLCFEYADKYARLQSEQFQRLGILGDWGRPYMTMAPEYEASTLEVFAKFVEAGLVYKKLKPVPWSISNQTALADAELEYKDVEDESIYVEFAATDSAKAQSVFGVANDPAHVFFLIWTTTPWTLPANLAIAVHPDVRYALVRHRRTGSGEKLDVVAENLVNDVFKDRKGVHSFEVVGSATGTDLIKAGLEYRHPFMDRTGKILGASYVTTEDGTGLVHTAPGHGEDDYNTGMLNGLEVYCPVLANGRFDDTVPEWLRGQTVFEGNTSSTNFLSQQGILFDQVKILHSYPHDWRSKKRVIMRATEQWFIKMDEPYKSPTDIAEVSKQSIRKRAISCVGVDIRNPITAEQLEIRERHEQQEHEFFIERMKEEEEGHLPRLISAQEPAEMTKIISPDLAWSSKRSIRFIPPWGQNRLRGMLESRPDWCISRQRAWGLPIPMFYNESGKCLLDSEIDKRVAALAIRKVAARFAIKGSDAWFTDSAADILGPDFPYPPGFSPDKLRKEQDIFDVWFESGSSWHAVLQKRDYLAFPADMYLEGSDQHRGWFQLSLLPSLGATGVPPFRQVLTHGFAVKPDGTKVSKSDKEYVTVVDEVNRHGADLLRLWVCSVDYQNDIPTSPKVIQEFGDKYRKIRNTLRYLLSNLYDFNPQADAQEIPQKSLDGWAMAELDKLIEEVTAGYDAYQTHRVFRLLHDFCAVQISAIYGNAMKDRLYCEAVDSPLRRRCQTVMHAMLVTLTKLLAPMLIFTADETWEHIAQKPEADAGLASVHLALLPVASGREVSDEQRDEWKLLMQLRDQALLQLDALKKQVGLNKAIDAEIIYQIDDDTIRRNLQSYGSDLEDLAGAGHYSIAEKGPEGPAVVVKVVDRRETYRACARSWKRRPDVGHDPEYPDLTLRDATVVRALKKRSHG
jgi:isoleucyl-tRNA synthetase